MPDRHDGRTWKPGPAPAEPSHVEPPATTEPKLEQQAERSGPGWDRDSWSRGHGLEGPAGWSNQFGRPGWVSTGTGSSAEMRSATAPEARETEQHEHDEKVRHERRGGEDGQSADHPFEMEPTTDDPWFGRASSGVDGVDPGKGVTDHEPPAPSDRRK